MHSKVLAGIPYGAWSHPVFFIPTTLGLLLDVKQGNAKLLEHFRTSITKIVVCKLWRGEVCQ